MDIYHSISQYISSISQNPGCLHFSFPPNDLTPGGLDVKNMIEMIEVNHR